MDNKEKIRLVYIDDDHDLSLDEFLDNYKTPFAEVLFETITFQSNDSYESLVENMLVQEANIIIIDSDLFNNKYKCDDRLTGEEFKLLLRKPFPYIEVIVISQNDVDDGFRTFPKYNINKNIGFTASEYYTEQLGRILENLILNILEYRKIATKINTNASLENVLVSKVMNSLNGFSIYEDLNKDDIDRLVEAFNEVQRLINE